ncbi:MAG: putative porin, partial [Bacteroidales bacterium]
SPTFKKSRTFHKVGIFFIFTPMKFINLIIILIACNISFLGHSQERQPVDTTDKQDIEIQTWQIDEFYKDTNFVLDTNWYNLHKFNPTEGKLYLSSFGSPINNPIISLNKNNRFIFSKFYKDYFYNHRNTVFYKTTVPFTYFNYNSGGGSDKIAKVKVLHTQNVNEYFNFTFRIKVNSSSRFYEPDDDKTVRSNFLTFSASYNRNLYDAYLDIHSNTVRAAEIGGIIDKEEFESGFYEIFTPQINDAESIVKSREFNFTQKFDLLGKLNNLFSKNKETERDTALTTENNANDSIPAQEYSEREIKDSTDATEIESGVIHELSYQGNKYKYLDANPLSMFYESYPIYIDSSKTDDHTRMNTLSNDAMLYFDAKDFNFIAGLGHEYVNYELLTRKNPDDTLVARTQKNKKHFNNVKIFARLQQQLFKTIEIEGDAESYFAGFKAGDLSGRFALNYSYDSTYLNLSAHYLRKEPFYYYQHYNSNHFQWDNNFDKSNSYLFELNYKNLNYNFNVNLHAGLLNNFIYFDNNANPAQHREDLNFLKIKIDKTFNIGNFFLDNKFYYQYSSDDEVFSYPEWYVQETLSWRHKFHFNLTDGNLSTQIGVNMYYFPEFYADAYMPALNFFYKQREQKIGGNLILDAFLNLKVKRTSAFLKLSHVNSPLQERNYYSTPDYPMPPMMFKFGVFWSFYD